MVSRMILYGVTVYNAILIISYRIITYKLIYITVPEEYPGAFGAGWPQAQGSPAGLGLREAKELASWDWVGDTQPSSRRVAGWAFREKQLNRHSVRWKRIRRGP